MGSDTYDTNGSDADSLSERDRLDGVDGDFMKRFDPDAPEFADIPMIRIDGDQITVLRGELPQWLTLERLRRQLPPPALVVGVFFNDLGEVELAGVDRVFTDVRHHSALWINQMISGATAEELLASLDRVRDAILERRDKGWVIEHGDTGEVLYTRR